MDDSPAIARRYMISGIPTIMIFKDGKVSETQVGLIPKEQLAGLIEKNLMDGN